LNIGLQRSGKVSALTNVINQNTPGDSQGYPLGVPTDYSWYSGDTGASDGTPPSNFSSITGWGQIYPEAGEPVDSTASVQIENFQTYVLLTNGSWVLVQNQSTDGISGAHYVADFSGNSSIPWSETTSSDGSVSVGAPPSGYNDHFYPGERGTYAPGTVEGVFVEASMKTSDANANLVANLGADWWLNSTAPYVSQNGVMVNNPGVGMSDWVKLTTQYQSLYYTSLSAAQLAADPPPGLTTGTGTGTTTGTGTGTTTGTGTGTTTGTGTGTTTGSSGGSTSSGGTTGTGSGSTTSGSGGTPPVTGSGTGVGTGASGGATPPITGSGTGVGTGSSGGATPPVTGSGAGVGTGASGGATPPVTGSGTGVGTGASGGATPPNVPVLSVTDDSLSVSRGHSVSLGIGVSVPNAGDNVTVNISGLPRYETITDNLDHKTFRGSSISLTAAEVDSGLTLSTHYRGQGDPTATLTVTATDSTGTPITTAAQTITVKDPTTAVAGAPGGASSGGKPVTWPTNPDPAKSSTGKPTGPTDWFSQHPDFAPVATTLSDAGASTSTSTPNVAMAAGSIGGAGAKSYALFNQAMAGDFGGDSHFAQAATGVAGSLQQPTPSLTKPLH
jgi:hypothetical protein